MFVAPVAVAVAAWIMCIRPTQELVCDIDSTIGLAGLPVGAILGWWLARAPSDGGRSRGDDRSGWPWPRCCLAHSFRPPSSRCQTPPDPASWGSRRTLGYGVAGLVVFGAPMLAMTFPAAVICHFVMRGPTVHRGASDHRDTEAASERGGPAPAVE